MVTEGREVLEGLHLSGVGIHTFGHEHCTLEADLWLHYHTLAAVEYAAIPHSSLHQLDKMPAVVLWGMAVDADIIMDGYDTRKMVIDLVHENLEDVLAHLQTKGHA